MQKMFKKMENLYADLADYYVFDKQKYTLEEFFADLKTFKDSYIQARSDNQKERDLVEKKEKARLAKLKQEKEKEERNKRRLIDMNPSETQEGVMDRLNFFLYTLLIVFYVHFSFLVYWKLCLRVVLLVENRRRGEGTGQLEVSRYASFDNQFTN